MPKVPNKGSALEELLGWVEKLSGAQLAATMDSWYTTSILQHCIVGMTTAIWAPTTVIPSPSILPPSAVIGIKNGIKLEYTQ